MLLEQGTKASTINHFTDNYTLNLWSRVSIGKG